MAYFSQLGVMLWKNWILQRRRKCVSVFEILIPLFFAALLLLLRYQIGTRPQSEATVYAPTLFSHGFKSDYFYIGHRSTGDATIGYTPKGKAVESVMAYVKEMYSNDIEDWKSTFKGFDDEEEMEEYAKDHPDDIDICIAFLNLDQDGGDGDGNAASNGSLPKNLRFAVRPRTGEYTHWDTRKTFDSFQEFGPRRYYNQYQDYGVILFQRIVGDALIKYWLAETGGNSSSVDHCVKTQRMAYPPYIEDPMLVVMKEFPTFLVLSVILSVIINTKNLVHEKERKLKESMKLMGLSASVHGVSWFITFSIYLVPILGLYAIFLGVPFFEESGAIFQASDTSVILVFLLAYGLAIITFSFMVASFVQKANFASALAGILFFLTYCPKEYLNNDYENLTKTHKLAFSLLTNCAMTFGSNIIGFYERTGEGAQWNNFYKPATKDDNLSLFECIVMLLLDSVLHMLVFWYLDNVRPGDFGVPKPYYFCFTKSYWFGYSQKEALLSRKESDAESRVRFEREPENLKPGITINKLTKVYGKNSVVNNLSLNMYEGQISVLLGHNGAGKTTTMSMLTGFIPPTNGSAVVNGYDITTNLAGVRSSLGLCPQHNILFDTLTVKEHLQFFARLKGATNQQAEAEIDPLLQEVGLLDRKHALSATLSGGQKRKLSVAIALIAGSKIVILDEPSTGMDPGARRQTWSVLQKHREGRTILLTTHYMDEADVLGDRIAIMAEGVVKCCGSSMFLKKLYGAGYHLVIVKTPSCVLDDVTKVVTGHVSSSKLETVINQEVTYLLPEKETAKFADLFRNLEDQKEQLGISSFGTSATTMEEVFLRVGESAHHHDDDDGENTNTASAAADNAGVEEDLKGVTSGSLGGGDNEKTPLTEEAPSQVCVDSARVKFSSEAKNEQIVDMKGSTDAMAFTKGYEKNTGLSLELGKMRGIFVKKALNTWRNRTVTLVQLLLPVIFACLALALDQIEYTVKEDPPLNLDLANFEPTIIPTTVGLSPTPEARRLAEVYGRQFDDSEQTVRPFNVSLDATTYDVNSLSLAKSMGLGLFNKRVIVGLEVASDEAKRANICATSHYNGEPLHAEPIGMHYLMNALLRLYLQSDSYSIEAVLNPLPREKSLTAERNLRQSQVTGYGIAFLISFGMAFLTTLFVHYLIKERQVGSKHLQVVSGVSPFSYWVPTFLWDFISYLVPVLCLLIVFAAFDTTPFTGGTRSMLVLLHFLMYGWAVLPFMYVLQFLFKNPPTGVNVIITLNIFSGLLCLLTITVLEIRELKLQATADALHMIFIFLFPNYSMAQGLVGIYTNYHAIKKCENFPCDDGDSDGYRHPCCRDGGYNTNYLAMSKPGIGTNILVFFISGIVYFLLVFLIDYHMLQKLWYAIVKKCCSKTDARKKVEGSESLVVDSDVAEESDRIRTNTLDELNKTDSLLLVDLYKKYGSLTAVDGLCLGIPQEECFGLLGQNGAGKTTTFKMLTGDAMVTGGNAYLAGHDIVKNIKQVQANMGYCPQFDALIEQMTGRETLTMYARLKGVPETHVKDVVDNLIHVLMLDVNADKLAGAYSGGNKRKLSTAIALVGLPQFIMLDEPSAGMDPKTRRQLWNVLSQVRAAGHTLILTSHSMEECDALCTRLAIMVNGKFVCLGSPQHLKNKFGEGYTLVVQLGVNEDGSRQPVQPIADHMVTKLPGIKVYADHQGYANFQVPDSESVKLADVFSLMEDTKERFNIQDYSVHQTTLEQVFLTFTRAQAVVEKPPKKKRCCL